MVWCYTLDEKDHSICFWLRGWKWILLVVYVGDVVIADDDEKEMES